MKLWIVRNGGSFLELHQEEPFIGSIDDKPKWMSDSFIGFILPELFPEITFENSPQEIEIKLVVNNLKTK